MPEDKALTAVRRDYKRHSLSRSELKVNPFEQFSLWFDQAQEEELLDPTAMTLATYNPSMGPTARIVLLKHYDDSGFCWYTDYSSLKGQQLEEIPEAELLFYWPKLERQIRVSGTVIKVDRSESVKYFNERPIGSRLSASVSEQSRPIDNRQMLESLVKELEEKYPDGDIPCPQDWGGYRLLPKRFEFWQGRDNRLHDRFQYIKVDEAWTIQRLCP